MSCDPLDFIYDLQLEPLSFWGPFTPWPQPFTTLYPFMGLSVTNLSPYLAISYHNAIKFYIVLQPGFFKTTLFVFNFSGAEPRISPWGLLDLIYTCRPQSTHQGHLRFGVVWETWVLVLATIRTERYLPVVLRLRWLDPAPDWPGHMTQNTNSGGKRRPSCIPLFASCRLRA